MGLELKLLIYYLIMLLITVLVAVGSVLAVPPIGPTIGALLRAWRDTYW